MRREAETLSKRHARANCLLEIVAFVVESLKTSNFASNLPARGKTKKIWKKTKVRSRSSIFEVEVSIFEGSIFEVEVSIFGERMRALRFRIRSE